MQFFLYLCNHIAKADGSLVGATKRESGESPEQSRCCKSFLSEKSLNATHIKPLN